MFSSSEFFFISNIPNKINPLKLMADVQNPFAKMTYFDCPDFKGNRQAFLFYPESDTKKWENLLTRLNAKDDIEASYIYLPGGTNEYITQIPPGAEVLPYIYVENLPKEVEFHHLVTGIPHIVNLRFMDVTFKEDKWGFIYLGNVSLQHRRNVLMGLRSKSFGGYQVYASEMMICASSDLASKPEDPPTPKPSPVVKTPAITSAFRSEFLFLYNVPQPLGHGKILHFIKSSGIKLARIFFVETNDYLKRGFLHMPGLSEEKWVEAVEMIRNHYFHSSGMPDNCGEQIGIAETWFQPQGASPPPRDGDEFELMDYYFVYNVPKGVSEQLLVHGVVLNRIRVQLFDPTPPENGQTRIGFAVKLGTTTDRSAVEDALGMIRRKRFGESIIYVDRIWRMMLPEDAKNLTAPICVQLVNRGAENEAMDSVESRVEICTRLKPPVSGMSKSNLFFLHGIPAEMDDASLFNNVFLNRSASFPSYDNQKRCCFVQPQYPDKHNWSCVLAGFYQRFANENLGAEINEVFKEDNHVDEMPEGIVRSCFLHVSNLALDVTEEQLSADVDFVEGIQFLQPPATDRSAIVLLSTSVDEEIKSVMSAIQGKFISGRKPAVSRLLLSSVENPPLWPSYRAPCQALNHDESIDDENQFNLSGDGTTNGKSEEAFVVIVEGLPLLINDSSIISIFGSSDTVEWRDDFCVISSPGGQCNRLLMYAPTFKDAQALTSAVMPLLRKNFRHRALLTQIRSTHDREEIIPVSEDVAFRIGSLQLLLYNLPRQSTTSVRAQLRQIVGNNAFVIDLKGADKKFIGHGIVTSHDWQSCTSLYNTFQGVKIGSFDIRARYLAK